MYFIFVTKSPNSNNVFYLCDKKIPLRSSSDATLWIALSDDNDADRKAAFENHIRHVLSGH
jgi:hypothetical protein